MGTETSLSQIGVLLPLPAVNFVPLSLRVCLFARVWKGDNTVQCVHANTLNEQR